MSATQLTLGLVYLNFIALQQKGFDTMLTLYGEELPKIGIKGIEACNNKDQRMITYGRQRGRQKQQNLTDYPTT